MPRSSRINSGIVVFKISRARSARLASITEKPASRSVRATSSRTRSSSSTSRICIAALDPRRLSICFRRTPSEMPNLLKWLETGLEQWGGCVKVTEKLTGLALGGAFRSDHLLGLGQHPDHRHPRAARAGRTPLHSQLEACLAVQAYGGAAQRQTRRCHRSVFSFALGSYRVHYPHV